MGTVGVQHKGGGKELVNTYKRKIVLNLVQVGKKEGEKALLLKTGKEVAKEHPAPLNEVRL